MSAGSRGRWRVRVALAVAILADVLQLALFPLFAEGVSSPLNDAVEIAVAILLIGLLGFHWVLLPSAVLEALPLVDMAPTWTLAVAFITRNKPNAPVEGESEEKRLPTPPSQSRSRGISKSAAYLGVGVTPCPARVPLVHRRAVRLLRCAERD